MYKLIDLGVDGLMTDKPTVLKRALTKRGLF
jgi:glycerophosphoryl diester phosphodiesterase